MSSLAASTELNVERIALRVADIRCAACVLNIEAALNKLAGVKLCRTNLPTKTVVVDYVAIDADEITDCIEQLGFSATEFSESSQSEALLRESRSMLSRLGVAGIGMMQVMMFALAAYLAGPNGIEPAYEQLMNWASLAIALPVTIYSAAPFHQAAFRDLKRLNLGMDVPVSLAILAAFSVSCYHLFLQIPEVYFDSVCMFTFLLLIGRYVELSSRRQYQDGVSLSESCLPEKVLLIDGLEVAVTALVPGDRIRVGPGEVIPGDGIVQSGESSVSEMAFTGESLPLSKKPADRVLAGAENLDGELIIEVTVPFSEFVIQKMSELYRESTLYKPKFSILADKIARYFVACILLLSAASGLGWFLAGAEDWFIISLTVLVVSCPCALSLATPVAYTVAVSALRRFGVVVSTGEFLEKLAATSHIVFDKTGTLTEGKLVINQVISLAGLSEDEVLEICTALERCSQHPIARAFNSGVALTVDDAQLKTGAGVGGRIKAQDYRLGKPSYAWQTTIQQPNTQTLGMWILLASDRPLAWIHLSDEIRAEAGELIASIKADYEVSLLTGDGDLEAARVAKSLAIDNLISSATPEIKLAEVRRLQACGGRVLMVGDGINDAAAMGAAHTSVAINPVDIVVQEAAEATLVQTDVRKIRTLLAFSHRVRRVIRQNVFWAVAYNLSVIPLAVAGILAPWMAALGMSFSSLLVVLNANRLAKVKE